VLTQPLLLVENERVSIGIVLSLIFDALIALAHLPVQLQLFKFATCWNVPKLLSTVVQDRTIRRLSRYAYGHVGWRHRAHTPVRSLRRTALMIHTVVLSILVVHLERSTIFA
jgi:hypothetical protein